MFETILGLHSSFSEMSLQRLSSILKQPTKNHAQKLIQDKVQQYFDQNQSIRSLVQQKNRSIDQIGKEQFFVTFKKAFSKCVKVISLVFQRQNRKIEEIINSQSHRTDSKKQWVKDFFAKLQYIAISLYHFIKSMQQHNKWDYCMSGQCQFMASSYKFQIDIFNYIVQTNQVEQYYKQALRNEVKRLVQKKQSPHMLFDIQSEILQKNDLLSSVDFVLSMEINCQDHGLNKKNKKKNKKKIKKIEKMSLNSKDSQQEEMQQNQRRILFMLNTLEVCDEDRGPCHVTEEWISRISSAYGKK